MPRSPRKALGGIIYHVLNRGNQRAALFDKEEDYEAFERILEQACFRFNMRLLAYCLMPSHWHLLLWPRADGDLSRFMAWVTLTHTQRRHAHLHWAGAGHIYQGRFTGAFHRGVSSRFPRRVMSIFMSSRDMRNATHCGQGWSSGSRTGAGPACGDANAAQRRRC